MNWNRFVMVCALGAAVCRPGAPRADAPGPGTGGDLASEVRAVFSARCASCHGPHLPRPKGRFGYVLDLRRVASNPEMVTRPTWPAPPTPLLTAHKVMRPSHYQGGSGTGVLPRRQRGE